MVLGSVAITLNLKMFGGKVQHTKSGFTNETGSFPNAQLRFKMCMSDRNLQYETW